MKRERKTHTEERKSMNEKPRNIPTMKGVAQTAHDAGVPVHFVRQLVKQNKISFVMAGKKALINWDGFLDYLERGERND